MIDIRYPREWETNPYTEFTKESIKTGSTIPERPIQMKNSKDLEGNVNEL